MVIEVFSADLADICDRVRDVGFGYVPPDEFFFWRIAAFLFLFGHTFFWYAFEVARCCDYFGLLDLNLLSLKTWSHLDAFCGGSSLGKSYFVLC